MELLDDKMRVWLESAKFVKSISGIYVFYNRNKEPIFVGETENLEKTFTNFLDTDFDENECLKKTAFYQRIFTDNQKQEQLELINKIKNETGSYPSCNSEIEIQT
ncbi:GIY-YIG nuclease family protein [Nitrosopumilus sp.]|nr:GIY-YIG nuclease family protein [Nitrosopumilus sp.]MDC0208527.1 GIY-YIG nuclease family protein [Nitrosopumilus sp.]MDC0228856.1 GIY-YIG nuclease family protein [Nitrosopumilus sp.]